MGLAVLIQGNLHINSINCISHYIENVDEVVYSTYFPINIYENTLLDKLKETEAKIILSEYPDIYNICNTGNSYYQIVSTHNGLKNINSDYTIKIRSSFGLNNINPLIDMIKNSDKMIISSNIGFAKIKNTLYHPSDHLFSMNTELMSKSFELLKYRFDTNYNWRDHGFVHPDNGDIVIENKICVSCLESLGITPNFKSTIECRDQMERVYDIIDINTLLPTAYSSVFNTTKFEGGIYNYFAKNISEI